MSSLTLPGDLPGLMRESTPAEGEHGPCIVLAVAGAQEVATGQEPATLVALVAWLHPVSPVRRSVVALTSISVRLDSSTGLVHAPWWARAQKEDERLEAIEWVTLRSLTVKACTHQPLNENRLARFRELCLKLAGRADG